MTNGGSEVTIQQPLLYLTLDALPTTGYLIEDNFRVGNHAATAHAFAAEYADAAGSLDKFQLANNPTYAYLANRYAAGTMNQENGLAFLHAFIVKVQLLLLGLWMVKDNSANAWTAYFRLDDDAGPHFLSEGYMTFFFTADCELRAGHFNAEEFERAVAFYRQFDGVIPKLPYTQKRISGLTHDSRLARTLYFLQAGRNTSDLLIKIAFYCMCLESLFSTDKEGITYRIAERTALFIGSNGLERRKIFEDVAKLYGTRSKVVHGDLVKHRQLPDLIERVKRGDGYLRSCLRRS
jgi:hypothetical protein